MSGSSSRPKVNLRSTAVKRIMQEASELANPQEDDFTAAPLESDIFEWHCTMKGVPGSEYEGGLYHLRILLPPSYPMSAPDIILLTPNGRFELGKKICIDGLTSFHAGSWQPAWGVRTGLRSFWMQGGEALSAIGALDYSKEERQRLAKLSREWVCPTCGEKNSDLMIESNAGHNDSGDAGLGDSAPTSSRMISTDAASPAAPEDDGRIAGQETETADVPGSTEEILQHPPDPSPIASLAARQLAHTPAPTARQETATQTDLPQTRPVPKWIDGAIVVLVSILVLLIARRLT